MAIANDFSEWDFLNSFSAIETAALIAGENPKIYTTRTNPYKNIPIFRRLADDYMRAWTFDEKSLKSFAFDAVFLFASSKDVRTLAREWLDSERGDISGQEFEREEICRWLTANGLKSVYPFGPRETVVNNSESGKWPWGSHTTDLLGHLEAAAHRFWKNYDMSDIGTAPTNRDVAEWLVKERSVSKTMADAIASILRIDGLRTGPRE